MPIEPMLEYNELGDRRENAYGSHVTALNHAIGLA
jgi:hypothetical protein